MFQFPLQEREENQHKTCFRSDSKLLTELEFEHEFQTPNAVLILLDHVTSQSKSLLRNEVTTQGLSTPPVVTRI